MTLLTRGHVPLRSQLRSQSYKLSALQHPHPSVCYLSLFSTSAHHADRKTTTATQSNTPSSTNTNTVVTTPTRTEINAPISTFPAPIEIPPQDPSSSSPSALDKIKRLVSTGRAYLTFYKTGLKNVFRNYRASIPLRKSLGLPIYLPVSPPRNHNAGATAAADLGRGQFQLVRRSARDVRRMIPFTLILIICGEFTPLIVPIFGSAITPATCRVPSQITKEREAGSKRKYLALTAHANAQAAQQAGTMPTTVQIGSEQEMTLLATRFANAEFARDADASGVLAASAVFGIVKSHQPRLGG
ncbi:unnamed protein product [Penicillium pancosmium]